MMLAAIDWYACFFMLFAGLACVFAAAVLFSPNIVRMAFFLTLSLGATAGLFFLAGATFVGAMQLMIYVGGTLVLLIFGVMLTAQTPFISMRTISGEWVLAVIVGSTLFFLLLSAAFSVPQWRQAPPARPLERRVAQTATALGAGLSGVRVDQLEQDDPVLRRGMSGYLFPFVIVSVHLLVVLIGAAYLARTRTPEYERQQRTGVIAAPAGQRSVLLTGWLGLLLAGGLVALGMTLVAPDWMRSWSSDLAAVPGWVFAVGGLLAAVHVVAVLALFSWQRWGFYLAIAVAVVSVLMVAAGVGPLFGGLKLLGQAVTLGVLYALLRAGGERSAWAAMENHGPRPQTG